MRESRVLSSSRLSSRNCSPNFVFVVLILSSRKRFSFLQLDFVLGYVDIGLLLLPLPPLLLIEEVGFTRIVEATVSRCMLESLTFVSTLFETCEPYSWCSTVGLWRFATQIIEVLFLLAQFWTLTLHPRFHKIQLDTFRSIQWWYL